MFTRQRVPAYLKQTKLKQNDKHETLAILTFYLTPIEYELAVEIHPHIADRIFRKVGHEYKPVQEITSVLFHVEPESCSMEWIAHPDLPKSGGYIPHVAFSALRAFRLFADKPDFTLGFNATFVVTSHLDPALALCTNWLEKSVLVTFSRVQGALPFTSAPPKCIVEDCDDPPRYRTTDGKQYFCTEHPRAAGDLEIEELSKDERIKFATAAADEKLEDDVEASKPVAEKRKRGRPRKDRA